jgi:DNA-directed RNA polymerase
MKLWNSLSDEARKTRFTYQHHLEESLTEHSLNKYWKGYANCKTSCSAEQDLIQDFIRQCTNSFDIVKDEISNDGRMREWAPALFLVPSDILAGIVISQIVEDLVDSRDIRKKLHSNGVDNFYSVAYRVGKEAKLIASFKYAKLNNKEEYKYVNKYVKRWDRKRFNRFTKRCDGIQKWTKKQTLYLGTCLLNVAKAHKVVNVEQKSYKKGGKTRSYNEISVDPNILLELIRRHDEYQFLRLLYRPMLVPPVPHTLDMSGGCLLIDRRKPVVGGISKANQVCLDALNKLQTTEWSVNTRVLEVMETIYKRNSTECNMPAYDFEEFTFLRPFPENGTSEEKLSWKRDKEDQYAKWYKEVQKRAQMEIRLSLAKKLLNTKFFYHAYTFDFRGRIYTVTEMLSPQSGDFDRGLIQFSTPCKVTKQGLYWLMVHVANCFDGVDFGNGPANDKDSFDDRVRWVKAHIKNLRKISEDPYKNNLWMDNETVKKNPSFQRLAAAMDLVSALDTGYSSIPVQLDGSCNGSQHWSAIMRDPDLASKVNVAPTSVPGDLYQLVADVATEICQEGDTRWKEIFYEHWEQKIPRKVVKRSTMCDAYGITDHGIRRYCREEGHLEWVDSGNSDKTQAVNELALIIRRALDGALQSANAGKFYLQELTELCTAYHKHASWVTPSGFKVVNRYTKEKVKVLDTHLYRNSRLQLSVVEDTKEPSVNLAVQAVSPNYIHSIDAAHATLAVLDMTDQGVDNFSIIHDSFGCPCSEVPIMRAALTKTFYEIHKTPLLQRFKENIEDVIGSAVKPPPESGEFCIDAVRDSDYLFG